MKRTAFLVLLTAIIDLVSIPAVTAQTTPNEVNFSEHKRVSGYRSTKRKNPQMFQGNKETENYFEGWYFKMVSSDGGSVLSVIPGISLSQNGEEQHAFIQIIDGKSAETFYYRFDIKEFHFSSDRFSVRIGTNHFSEDSIVLNLRDDSTTFSGTIHMANQVHFSKKRKKSIMGWYRFVPFMQCYHDVVSLDHTLTGSLTKNETVYSFDNGIGYIEKDWGESMPSAWIWLQTNSFEAKNSSFMLSVANIPWLGSSFTGFLGFFLHDGEVHSFATYTHAKLEVDASNSDTLRIVIADKLYTYQLEAYRNQSGLLQAPVQGSMDRRIAESIDAKLVLTVTDKEQHVIFKDSTEITGLETVGDFQSLRTSKKRGKP